MSVFADRFSPKLGQDRAQLRVRSAKKRCVVVPVCSPHPIRRVGLSIWGLP
jgi:hypothetical protein